MPYPLLTKTRFNQFKEALNEATQLDTDTVIAIMMRVFDFDPNKVTYTPTNIEHNKLYLRKKQEETGLSTYQIMNQSKYYQENKERLNTKRSENRRKAKERLLASTVS
jgi:hypothetical protein